MPDVRIILSVFVGTFILSGFIYSLISSFSRILYVNENPLQLTLVQLKILNGTASFTERVMHFCFSFIVTPVHLPSYLIAMGVTIIFIALILLKLLIIPIGICIIAIVFIKNKVSGN